MKPNVVRQWRGAKDLLEDAVLAGADAAERLQLSLTRQPYAVLEKISPIAAPARAVGEVQIVITVGVYRAIRSTARMTAAIAGHMLDLAERT